MPGAKEIVESQGSASNTSRSVPVASIARCWSTTIGTIAVVVADDQRRARRQVEARNVPVGLNQIGCIRAGQRGEVKVRSSRVGPAQICAGEVSAGEDDFTEVVTVFIIIWIRITREIRIGEVGLAQVRAGQVISGVVSLPIGSGTAKLAFARFAWLILALARVAP